ncbi:hypothetical protein TNCV_5109531 [Trichonephila clavipes]|nr:hypothetical protein TNCV_5109531 [Trichonephila clavipes]
MICYRKGAILESIPATTPAWRYFFFVPSSTKRISQATNETGIEYGVAYFELKVVSEFKAEYFIKFAPESPSQYGGYDPRLVKPSGFEFRVRLGCIFFGKGVGLSPEMESRLERNSSAPLVICWDHRL